MGYLKWDADDGWRGWLATNEIILDVVVGLGADDARAEAASASAAHIGATHSARAPPREGVEKLSSYEYEPDVRQMRVSLHPPVRTVLVLGKLCIIYINIT